MLQTGETENEILLGNKQLLAIFFVVVLLLGVAFAGGYKLGQASKKSTSVGPVDTASANSTQTAGQTHEVTPGNTGDSTASTSSESGGPASDTATATAPEQTNPKPQSSAPAAKHRVNAPPAEDTEAPGPASTPLKSERPGEFVPQAGQLFLQVAAVGRDEAEGVADVLRKRGFRAHAVPKPGSPKIFRVVIGPLRDTADLNSTREALRRTGFREVITQRY